MKLPTLDPAEVIQHAHFLDFLKIAIQKAGGTISFAEYMEMALYHKNWGYYASASTKWGPRGDYVTAPHLSPWFAESIAQQFAEILQDIPEGDILELGAGSGIFAKDVLIALEKNQALPAHYYIYEKSPALREMQKVFLEIHCPQFLNRIHWLETLDGFQLTGIIFGNEVLDALPCHIFHITEGAVKEKCVTFENDQLQWQFLDPLSKMFKEKMNGLMDEYFFSNGYESELHLDLIPFMQSLENILKKGAVLLLDYGYGRKEYYHPDRSMGTLMCYFKHHRHDNPLLYPGLQDITAHVDFTSVIENTNFDLLGFTTQAGFLLGLNVLGMMADKNISLEENSAFKRLVLPQEMGESIKVIGLGKNYHKKLSGFGFQDRRYSL
jgi:SAM-dependent MidA family methyltransferase